MLDDYVSTLATVLFNFLIRWHEPECGSLVNTWSLGLLLFDGRSKGEKMEKLMTSGSYVSFSVTMNLKALF